MINPQWLELFMFRTNLLGVKYFRVIEVRLYMTVVTDSLWMLIGCTEKKSASALLYDPGFR